LRQFDQGGLLEGPLMHYYQFNIADYRKDTGHLTLLEHGIYRSLLDTYYLNELPLCKDDASLMRTHSIRTDEETKAFKNIIADYFILTKKGYTHKKCADQISKYNAKSDKARLSAKVRWDAEAMRTHSEGNANHKPLTNNHKPITIVKDVKASKIPTCPHDEIIDLYHKILPDLQSVKKQLWAATKREKDLLARWKQSEDFQDLRFWEWYFNQVKKSRFHMGENERGWKADLGWLIQKEKFTKLVEAAIQ